MSYEAVDAALLPDAAAAARLKSYCCPIIDICKECEVIRTPKRPDHL
jgi:hypothetical protein